MNKRPHINHLDFASCHEGRVYLDHNATTPLAAFLKDQVYEWLDYWGNPSSIHWDGRGPKKILRQVRKDLAHFIGASSPLEIVFTSGGSESNNLAIKGVFDYFEARKNTTLYKNRYITTTVEHPSVMKSFEYIKSKGAEVYYVPVNRKGELDFEAFKSVLNKQTALVSVMYANNETGTIFPIQQLAEMAHQAGAYFHSDAVQAMGKTLVDIKAWGVDLASFSGHKFYSLKGGGFLYSRGGMKPESLIHGGAQERKRRAGTENLLSMATLGAMTQYKEQILASEDRIKKLRNLMEVEIVKQISGVVINAYKAPRISNTSSIVLKDIDGETLLMNLDMKGYAVSTGAACSSGSPEPSPVLLAMGLSREEAQSSLRLSLGWGNTELEILKFVEDLKSVVAKLRGLKQQELKSYGL